MRILPTFLVPLVLACADVVGPGDFSAELKQWQAQAPSHYQFEQSRSCFCAPPHAVRIEVRNNQIVAVTDRQSGAAVPSENWAGFYTIDGLFELIADAEMQNPAKLEVKYHSTEHYPTSIDIDYQTMVADDEFTINAASLISLP